MFDLTVWYAGILVPQPGTEPMPPALEAQGPNHWCVCMLSCSVMPNSLRPCELQPNQAPLSMGFSSKNTGVGCHSFLKGIFLTQGSSSGLLQCRQISLPLSH